MGVICVMGQHMKRACFKVRGVAAVLTIASAMAAAFLPTSSAAMPAFAAGIPNDVADKGVAMGEAHDFSSRDDAEARAIEQCQTNKDTSAEVHGLCRIIDHFDNRCLVTALDPKAGTPGWGWAIADTKDQASNGALAMCRSTAGADRQDYCVVVQSVCDGTAGK